MTLAVTTPTLNQITVDVAQNGGDETAALLVRGGGRGRSKVAMASSKLSTLLYIYINKG